MKHLIHCILGFALACTAASLHAENATSGYIDFGKLTPSGASGEFVEVHVRSNLIAMVSRLAEKAEPDIAQLLRGLHAIRVNVIGLTDENRAEMQQRIKAIREDLDARQWERVVTAQQPNEDVGVYLKTRGDEAVEGLVVTVVDGKKEAVLVNIVGDIRPEKLAVLGERFNIEPLKKIGHGIEKK